MQRYDLTDFKDKDIIFTGENRDMAATAQFLRKYAPARSFTHKFVDLNDPATAYEQFGEPDLSQTIIVKTAGISGSKMGAPYLTSTQLFFKLIKPLGSTTIGITGTKGKTTTSSLIAAMLQQAGKQVVLCGNIGIPMIALLDEATAETLFVIELSSYQLDELRVSPNIACVTNLYTDHLDYHGSLEVYWGAKRHIVQFMESDDRFVYNPAFDLCAQWAEASKATAIAIDTSERLDMSQTQLIGDHNRLNAIMAKTVAMQVGASEPDCLAALHGFQPIKHRLQKVATIQDVTFIDDAIASQPEAAIAGLLAITKHVCPVGLVMLGGKDRGYDFVPLLTKLAEYNVPALVLFPETVEKIKGSLPAGYAPELLETSSMDEAVTWAYEHAPKGSAVLLSTGAPSYSLWKDFEEKGDQFQTAVLNLAS